MDIDASALEDEVRKLCRRDAARDPRLGQRLGPQLRHIAGVSATDSSGQIRQKLSSLVERCMRDHPEEKATTLLAALGLFPPASEATLSGRLGWLARRRFMAVRTARRRLDDAIDLFVQAAVVMARASSTADDVGYVVDTFDGTVTFDGDRIRFIERRKVKVVRDQLRVIRCRFGVPSPPRGDDEPGFNVDILYGGLRCDVGRQTSVFEHWVEVGQPLVTGQMHEFEIGYELPSGQPMDPHYVVQPAAPFSFVSLTVRFDPCRVPGRAWRINGAVPGEVDNCPSDDRLLSLDPSACVRATFHDVQEGRTYGIAWDWT